MSRPTLDELRAKVGSQRGDGWNRRYAAEPGTGPAGKTCRDCAFLAYSHHTQAKHPKCGKNPHRTSGDATTIKTSSPACSLFVPWEPRAGMAGEGGQP